MTTTEARKVLGKATPGPWVVDEAYDEVSGHAVLGGGETGSIHEGSVAYAVRGAGLDPAQDWANARAIVLAVNLTPALLDVAEAAERTPCATIGCFYAAGRRPEDSSGYCELHGAVAAYRKVLGEAMSR